MQPITRSGNRKLVGEIEKRYVDGPHGIPQISMFGIQCPIFMNPTCVLREDTSISENCWDDFNRTFCEIYLIRQTSKAINRTSPLQLFSMTNSQKSDRGEMKAQQSYTTMVNVIYKTGYPPCFNPATSSSSPTSHPNSVHSSLINTCKI